MWIMPDPAIRSCRLFHPYRPEIPGNGHFLPSGFMYPDDPLNFIEI